MKQAVHALMKKEDLGNEKHSDLRGFQYMGL